MPGQTTDLTSPFLRGRIIYMKKLLALIIILSLSVVVFADPIDLSKMTYEELVQLKDAINLAIWNSKEWQEVEVPAGVWKVGKDIPAGHWTIKLSNPKQASVIFAWGDFLNESKTKIDYKGKYDQVLIYGEKSSVYKEGNMIEYSFEVTDGQWIVINDKSVIFTPFAGKPSFGFK